MQNKLGLLLGQRKTHQIIEPVPDDITWKLLLSVQTTSGIKAEQWNLD